MSRGKNRLPTVSSQFLTLNYPRPDCFLKVSRGNFCPTTSGCLFWPTGLTHYFQKQIGSVITEQEIPKITRKPLQKKAPVLPKIGGSLVGVWNGWGYGLAFFRALNFQISAPEIWGKLLFLRNFRDFPGNFGL